MSFCSVLHRVNSDSWCVYVCEFRKACIDLQKLAKGELYELKMALNYADRDGNSHLHTFAMYAEHWDDNDDCER
jgi:hypothetical protein